VGKHVPCSSCRQR